MKSIINQQIIWKQKMNSLSNLVDSQKKSSTNLSIKQKHIIKNTNSKSKEIAKPIELIKFNKFYP